MTSRSNPPVQSKIPKLQTAPPSPRNRTPPLIQGSPAKIAQVSKPQSALTSPRHTPTRVTTHSIPLSSATGFRQLSVQNCSPNIMSKSCGQTMLAGSSPPQSPPVFMQESKGEHGQGEGRIGQSKQPVDVDVIYAANPLRIESTSAVTSPKTRKSSTYLDIFRQKQIENTQVVAEASSVYDREGGSGDIKSCRGFGDSNSFEWDFGGHQCQEICTQTSRTVGTVDRCSSAFKIISDDSIESLLENQTKPVIFLDQTRELEESDAVSDNDITENQDNVAENHLENKSTSDDESTTEITTFYLKNGDLRLEPVKQVESQVFKTIGKKEVQKPTCNASKKPTNRHPTPLVGWHAEKLLPKLNVSASGRAIEVHPSPAPLTLSELKSSASLKEERDSNESALTLSIKSSLVLKSVSSSRHCGMYESTFHITNSSAFTHGFKIMANAAASKHLIIKPTMGLIPAHGQVGILISTIKSVKCSAQQVATFRVAVKLFRAHCDDRRNLKQFYHELETQHPELIRTHNIQRMIIWDNDNMTEVMNTIDSIANANKEKREKIKDELYAQISSESIHGSFQSDKNVTRLLKDSNVGIAQANQNMRRVVLGLSHVRSSILFGTFVAMCLFGTLYMVPPFMANGPKEEPPIYVVVQEELSIFEQIRNLGDAFYNLFIF